MSNYPDGMDRRHLDEPELDPAVEEAHDRITAFATKISAAVDAALTVLRPDGIGNLNEAPFELFEIMAELYDWAIEDDIKRLKNADVSDPYEHLLYKPQHVRERGARKAAV